VLAPYFYTLQVLNHYPQIQLGFLSAELQACELILSVFFLFADSRSVWRWSSAAPTPTTAASGATTSAASPHRDGPASTDDDQHDTDFSYTGVTHTHVFLPLGVVDSFQSRDSLGSLSSLVYFIHSL
jgi:hypothetical protein